MRSTHVSLRFPNCACDAHCAQLKLLDKAAFESLGSTWCDFYARVAKLRGVKEFLQYRPKAGTGKVGRPGSLIFTTELEG